MNKGDSGSGTYLLCVLIVGNNYPSHSPLRIGLTNTSSPRTG